VVIRGKCAKGKSGLLFLKMFFYDCLKEFFGDHIIEASVEVVEVKGGVAVFSSEHSGDCDVLEFIIEDCPLVTKSDHIFDTFFTLLLE